MSTDTSKAQKVIEIIAEQLGLDIAEVTPEKSFIEDLNADSLDFTELVMIFEETFSCEIAEDQAENLKSVGDVIKYIEGNSK